MSFKYHYLKKQIYQELFPTGIEEYECTYCSNKVYRHNCTLDHVIPVSKNGSHIRENLVISCQNCNWTKESKTLQEFFEFVEKKHRRNPKYFEERFGKLKGKILD